MRVLVMLGSVLLFVGAVQAGGTELPRRGYLGLTFDLADRSGPGLLVTQVARGSTAAQAGLRPGDRLTSVGGVGTLDGYRSLRAELEHTVTGSRIALRWYRGPNTVFRAAPALGPLPAETVPGSRVRYDTVQVADGRLRLIRTEPEAVSAARLIFYLPDRSCESLDFWDDPSHPRKRLIDGWAGRGFATARLEQHGVGDSDGPPCAEPDLAAEQSAYLAALAFLAEQGYGGRVLLFGHGRGGIVAPLVATDAVAAVMVYGVPASAATATPASYDPERSWRQVWQPVLILHGAYDGIVSRADQERIARLTGGRFQSLPGLGHDLLRYESTVEASAAQGTGKFDPAVNDVTATWIETLSVR